MPPCRATRVGARADCRSPSLQLRPQSPRVATSACGKQRCKIILPIVGWITLSRVELPGAQRAGTLPPDLWGAYAPRRRPDAEPLQWEKNAARRFGATSACLLYTSPSPRDATLSRMPSSA